MSARIPKTTNLVLGSTRVTDNTRVIKTDGLVVVSDKTISAEDIIQCYNQIKDKDAEVDLRNKFRALLYYHYMVDHDITDEVMLEVAQLTRLEFVCLLLARNGLVCYNGCSSASGVNHNTGVPNDPDVSNRALGTFGRSSSARASVACNQYGFSDLMLDNNQAKIRSKDDLILAIQVFSQRALVNYQFSEADIDVLPYAIRHYNTLAIDKILPFAKGTGVLSLQIPDLSDYPRLQEEMSRFRRDVVWYRQLQEVQKVNKQRLHSWSRRTTSIY